MIFSFLSVAKPNYKDQSGHIIKQKTIFNGKNQTQKIKKGKDQTQNIKKRVGCSLQYKITELH